MPKRKAVNDIIYELDNDDVEISSDDEAKEPKINRIDTNTSEIFVKNKLINEENKVDIINIECSSENSDNYTLTEISQNGGKTSPVIIYDEGKNIINNGDNVKNVESDVDSSKKLSSDGSKTTIFNEDIVIDSPASNSDLGVVGCENKTPLVTIRFRDNKIAKSCKQRLKSFMLKLIKLHDEENFTGSETETDLELDIWPEDLVDEEFEDKKEPEDGLFFIDTAPCKNVSYDIPKYKQVSTLISNVPPDGEEPSQRQVTRRGPICFNCDGNHPLRDCTIPKNKARIAEKRKNMATRVGRYHVEDEQKYGHLIGGRISGQLRHALGLKRHELPLHIYRMRLLGYPPGWLEEARISHSGISMFDSTGTAIQDPEEEDGELCAPGSKDKFDIKKILDFPGFNVPASSRYKEEAHLYHLPQISEQDSKMAMLQMLAPNAMKAYKRKKLTFFPSAQLDNSTQEGQAEMDLDSGDEVADFPSVPPLPDEAPPTAPLPPPPPSPPPLPPLPPPDDVTITLDDSQENTESQELSDSIEIVDDVKSNIPLTIDQLDTQSSQSSQELVTLDVDAQTDEENTSVKEIHVDEDTDKVETVDIPMPDMDKIDNDDENPANGRDSPSLDDLETKKLLLLQALESSQDSTDILILDDTENDEINQTLDSIESNSKIDDKIIDSNVVLDEQKPSTPSKVDSSKSKDSNIIGSDSEVSKTPDSKTGHIKTTAYGTPVVNIASSYVKLPADEKFAKDICDVINFENLPNSTGKYKQISDLLKKVKNEVDRIQDS